MHQNMKSEAIMDSSRVQRLETLSENHWEILFFIFVIMYISLISVLFLVKKHEFTPFKKVKNEYLQINPFEDHLNKSPIHNLQGKGVVVKLNTMCNSLIQPSPEFKYLVFSQNILGKLCAGFPSEVQFIAYIKYEKHRLKGNQDKNKIVYQLQKKVAVINWPEKELVGQTSFTKEYTFFASNRGLDSAVEEKLCSISEEPSDEEVKQWIASLASRNAHN